jgi:energy-coupling factor transport system permease protein
MNEARGLYKVRSSFLHDLFPLTRLSLMVLPLVSGLALPGHWTAYIIFFLVLVPLALWAHVLEDLLQTTWRIALPFVISVFIVQGFFWPGGTPVIRLGILALKREGLSFALAGTGRIILVIGSFLWFAFTTRPDNLMAALTQRGLSPSLSYIIVSTIQILPRFQRRAAAILDAQQARGMRISGRLVYRLRAIVPLVFPLILSSLIDVEERAMAIEARAFSHPGPKTSFIEIKEARWEPAVRWGSILAAAACLLVGIWLRLSR